MGLTTGNFPPVDPATFTETPYRDRIKTLAQHWAEYGFGAPKITAVIYIAKLLVLYMLGGVLVATLTTGLDPLEPTTWWNEPIIWQKFILWTVLLECIGCAGSWGPLAGHFKPFTAGFRHYGRVGTLRNPPWPERVPGTRGHGRTSVDVTLYAGLIASVVVALALPGTADSGVTAAIGANKGLVPAPAIVAVIALLVTLGLRDKIVFLAARGEQYLPALVFFAAFPFVDMIIAAKLLIVSVWFGAGFSKLNHHFPNVLLPMVSNTPWLSSKRIKRMHYRNFPEDLRPSKLTKLVAHGPAAFGELVPPLVLLFSQDPTVTAVAAVFMIGYHIFITSTFPVAVPLEWNVMFMFLIGFLFLGFPAHEGYAVADMDPALLALTLTGVLFFPVLGNLRPDLVSFLPSMRQYAGNWASAIWAFAPGAEEKLDEGIVKASDMQKGQLTEIYGADAAEVILHQLLAFRSLHSQGRGLNSVLMKELGDDIDTYTLREAEFSFNAVAGFNFGDGHLHDHRMIQAIQNRCHFAPGEFIVAWVESEPVWNGRQQYLIIDAAIGIVERGSWKVREAVEEQPWLPNGPIATEVTFRMPGYERVSHDTVVVAERELVAA